MEADIYGSFCLNGGFLFSLILNQYYPKIFPLVLSLSYFLLLLASLYCIPFYTAAQYYYTYINMKFEASILLATLAANAVAAPAQLHSAKRWVVSLLYSLKGSSI